ncbi:MAG TPA: DUF3443 family protein [Burkholderiaceae bacterium]|nr:DUF3443 family protein [Burkholderiaceae bacterium]
MRADSRAFRIALLASAAVAVASCGGGGGSASSGGPPPAPNVAEMVVDGGPIVNGAHAGFFNQGYVTVTVCVPSTSTCQSIDHVWVDTGSSGLRLLASAVTLSLPPSTQNSNPVANCVQFVSTAVLWGAVRTADVKISGESASSVPIQVIGDSSVPTTPASTCGTATANQNTVQSLGANGLLGVGVFQEDCGIACQTSTPAPGGFYYTCPGGTCAPVNMATTLQLQNVAGMFPTDNNGVLIQLPSLPASGMASATGSLIFGINTQTNNQLGSAMVFAVDPGFTNPGDIQTRTTYGDMSEPASFVDSGSNGWFFNDSALTPCPSMVGSGFYCTAASLSATMLPYNTPTNTTSFTYNFSIADLSTLGSTNAAFNNVGGPTASCSTTPATCSFDWGLPFFYGRSVFTAIENKVIGSNTGPFIAASTP